MKDYPVLNKNYEYTGIKGNIFHEVFEYMAREKLTYRDINLEELKEKKMA